MMQLALMIKLSLLSILLFIGLTAASQDTILRYSKGSHKVYLGEKKMKMKDLFKTMKPHPESYAYIQSARDFNFFAQIIYSIGAVPVGYALAYYLPSNEMKWPVLLTGVGIIGIGIPLNIRYLKQMQRAVNSFNDRNNSGFLMKSRFQFSMITNQNGIGIQLKL